MAQRFHWLKTVSALVLLCFSLTVIALSSGMRIYSSIGPGPGLFPLILAVILAGLTIIWLLFPVEADERPAPVPREKLVGVFAVVGAIVGSIVLMSHLGFTLTTWLAIVCVILSTGRNAPLVAVGLGLIFSLACLVLFRILLGVPLPASRIPFLNAFGL